MFVLLLDATIATGAAMTMAIRVLLDHNVAEEKIIVCTLVAAPQGVAAIASLFPKIKIIVGEVDWQGLSHDYHIVPGVGNFGDRYFGTELK